MVHPSGREIWRMFLCVQGSQSVTVLCIFRGIFSGTIRFRYHCTLKRPKYCTVVAVFRPGDTFSLPLYSESGKRLYDGGFATGK